MKPRHLSGEINRAAAVFVYVDFAPDDAGFAWLQVSKERAREIVDRARDEGIDDIAAHVNRKGVWIGDPEDFQLPPGKPADGEEE